jgi:hypothetical protein
MVKGRPCRVVATASRNPSNLIHEQGLPPIQQVDREEKASARDERATSSA